MRWTADQQARAASAVRAASFYPRIADLEVSSASGTGKVASSQKPRVDDLKSRHRDTIDGAESTL
jgi:hypothetical protein